MPYIKKIALFGGAFDPPHLGHKSILEILSHLDLFDEIWIIPMDQCDYKSLTPIQDRLQMLRLLSLQIPDQDSRKIRVKFFHNEDRKHFSKSIHLIHYLERQFEEKFFLVLGSDQFQKIDQWLQFEKILKREEPLVIIQRKNYTASKDCKHIHLHCSYPISSSKIRSQFKNHQKVSQISPRILQYIQENKLYQN